MGKIVSSINELSLPQGNYVLALPGWYPTWIDADPGDFNQRHVKAAGIYKSQLVLYIGKDTSNTIRQIRVQYHQLNDNVAEIIVLYPKENWKQWDVIQSNATYVKLLYKYAAIIEQKWGRPLLLHSYIVLRGGLSGWLLSRKWKLPFILTENWTIYYPADPGYLLKRNIVFRSLVKKIFKEVKHFLPVTENLQAQVQKLVSTVPSTVIPNVVETDLFYYKDLPLASGTFQFVHVSTMQYQKNPQGLLRAFKSFYQQHSACNLTMVGPYPPEVLTFARSLNLAEGIVDFTGSVPYPQVANIIQQSHALVLFSRYENLPCVILEALCCGVPVIATAVGGVLEVIDDSNGIIIESEKEEMLVTAFLRMSSMYPLLYRKKIAETAVARFSYEAVGQKINQLYNQILSS